MSKLIENMQSYQSGTDKEFLLILVLFKLNGLNFALLRKSDSKEKEIMKFSFHFIRIVAFSTKYNMSSVHLTSDSTLNKPLPSQPFHCYPPVGPIVNLPNPFW